MTQLESIVRQATLYGAQVRVLEDRNAHEDRALVREAWKSFKKNLYGTEYLDRAHKAYWDAYLDE